MEKLRMPEKRSMILSCWIFGALAGLSIPPLLSIVENGSRFAAKHANGVFILQVYGGLALPLIFTALFSLVVIAWSKYRVNYPFIFELDVCYHVYFNL
jgi:phosphotransferase system  glucose/maltose/N-acetylglucosamine-specific IIC component